MKGAEFLPKVCELSNGIDIPFLKAIQLKPLEVKKVGLGIKFSIPEGFCGLLMNKSSAYPKFKVIIILGLIDFGFKDELQVMVENSSKSHVTIEQGLSVCQLLILPSKAPILDKEKSLIKSMRGGFGSTGQQFSKISQAKTKNFKIKAKSSTVRVSLDKQSDYKQGNINLLKMAENSDISATAYLTLSPQSTFLMCYANNTTQRRNLDKKVYFATFINKLRVITCLDSGSDLTLKQECLFIKIFKSLKVLSKSSHILFKHYNNNPGRKRSACEIL
jgi:dUTP pyrophosphatase